MRAIVRENWFDYGLLWTITIAVCWRILMISLACLTAGLLYANYQVTSPSFPFIDDWEDRLILGIPILCFLTAFVSSVVALLPIERGIARGTLHGVVVGSGLVAVMMSWMVFSPTAAARIKEGMEYWVSVFLPSFWLGLPLILFGGLVGAKCGGAPIPIPVLTVTGLVLFAMPLLLVAAAAVHFILS